MLLFTGELSREDLFCPPFGQDAVSGEGCSGAVLYLNPEFCGAKSHGMRFLCN